MKTRFDSYHSTPVKPSILFLMFAADIPRIPADQPVLEINSINHRREKRSLERIIADALKTKKMGVFEEWKSHEVYKERLLLYTHKHTHDEFSRNDD